MLLPNSTDVVVIGGGPAGLAAGLALRARGFDVLVADGAGPDPIDKACGEGLMPDAVAALEPLGIDARDCQHWPFEGIRFLTTSSKVEAPFPHGFGVGVRRTTLHAAMTRAAADAGVRLAYGSPAAGIGDAEVQFPQGRVKTRWIVGADGGFSAVRRWTGLHEGMRAKQRYGFRKHFRVRPWSEFVEVYWGDGCQIYVTPVSECEVGVAVLSRDRRLRVNDAIPRFPALAKRLSDAAEVSQERGSVSASRRLRRVSKGRAVLIGDASGSVDAVTGEGLSLAFHQASALAAAISAGDLSRYEKAHARIRRTPAMMGEALLLLDGFSSLRNRVLPAMAARPKLFESMLAGHVGAAHPVAIAANLVALGWAILF
jgi:flavin-dependent dehydrogenase